MGHRGDRSDGFVCVGECLYRYAPNGRYYAFIKHQGRLTKKSLRTDDLATAKRLLRDERDRVERVTAGAGRMPLGELCDEYLSGLAQASKTVRQKSQIAERVKTDWPHPARGGCRIAAIKPADVKKWLASYRFGPSSFNAHLWFIRSVFEHAVENRYLALNPAATAKAKKRPKPIRKTPTFEQFLELVRSIREQTLNARAEASADLVEFMGLAGVGNAEAKNLTWGDIDFSSREITLFRQKTKMGYRIPVFPQLRALLERLFGDDGRDTSQRVFAISDAKKALKGACERLGYPPFDHRSLRRMFVTRALQKGVDVKTVSLWQGHRDGGKLILSTYSHVLDDHSKKMAKLMESD